ncbi:MAG: right-handed parallel beta-helix repeat-containing protein [Thermoplasmatota archaeon]
MISITGDDDLLYQASINGWSGNGSKEDPVSIKDLSIDAKDYEFCMDIVDISKHVLIDNCTFSNTSYSIYYGKGTGLNIQNVTNLTVRSCHFFDNEVGISIGECGPDIIIDDSHFENNSVYQIEIYDSERISINGSRFLGKNVQYGIWIDRKNFITTVSITNCSFNNSPILFSTGKVTIENNILKGGSDIIAGNNDQQGMTVIRRNVLDQSPIGVGTNALIEDNRITSRYDCIRLSFQSGYFPLPFVAIRNNTVISGSGGIFVWDHSVEVSDNTIISNRSGILLGTTSPYAEPTRICNNTLLKNGIDFEGSSYENAVIENNTLNGGPIIFMKNIIGPVQDLPSNTTQLLLVDSQGLRINRLSSLSSLSFWSCSRFMIDNCTISGGYRSIYLLNSIDYVIENNSISNSYIGIEDRSYQGSIINNRIDVNGKAIDAMGFAASPLTITGNIISNSSIFFSYQLNCHTIKNNTVNGGELVYLDNDGFGEKTYEGMIGQIIAYGSRYIIVKNQTFSHQYSPVLIQYCQVLRFENCTFVDNLYDGINFKACQGMSISNCSFIRNRHGLYSDSSGSNNRKITVQDCEFLENTGYGIYYDTYSSAVENCTFVDNYVGMRLHALTDSIPSTFCWNLFIGNGYYGAWIGFDSQTVMNNNSFIDNNGPVTLDEYETCQMLYDSPYYPVPNFLNNYFNDVTGKDENWDGYLDSGVSVQGYSLMDSLPLSYSPHVKTIEASCSSVRSTIVIEWTAGSSPYLKVQNAKVLRSTYKSEFVEVGNTSGVEPFIDVDTFHGTLYYYLVIPQAVSEHSGTIVPGSYSALISEVCDGKPPEVDIASPYDHEVFGYQAVLIEWSSRDTLHGVIDTRIEIDGTLILTNYTDLEGSITVTNISSGHHQVKISACDEALNWGLSEVNFIMDLEGPMIEFLSPTPYTWMNKERVTIKCDIRDEWSKLNEVQFLLPGFHPIPSGYFHLELEEGWYHGTMIASDTFDNTAMKTIEFGVDLTDPEIRLKNGDSAINTTDFLLEWTCSDRVSGLSELRLTINDEVRILDITDHFLLTDLAEGEYTISLVAVDNAGNHGHGGEIHLIVDRVDPEMTLLYPDPGDLLNDRTVTVRWSSADNGTMAQYHRIKIDDKGWFEKGIAQFHTFYDLKDGYHRVTLKCYDPAGNSVERTVWFTVDATRPYILGFLPGSSPIEIDPKITIHFSEPMDEGSVKITSDLTTGSTICRWDIAIFTSNWDLNYATDYGFFVTGKDLAGNDIVPTPIYLTTVDRAWIIGSIRLWKDISVQALELTMDDGYVPFDPSTGAFNITTSSGHHSLRLTYKGSHIEFIELELDPGERRDLGDIVFIPDEGSTGRINALGLLILVFLVLLILGTLGLLVYFKMTTPLEPAFTEE